MGNYILFTDATLFINKERAGQLLSFVNQYTHIDLCFADNYITNECNIGIILIRCSTKTQSFFERIREELIELKGWDQTVVNKHLYMSRDLTVQKFDHRVIFCNWEFDPIYKDTFILFKSFAKHEPNMRDTINNRFNIFKRGGLITEEEYKSNYFYPGYRIHIK